MKRVIVALLCILLLATGCSKSSQVAVPNAKAAKEVAQTIFDDMEKDEVTKTFVIDKVFYNGEEEAWVVVFWHDSSQNIAEPMSTGSICITIREKDGQVLNISHGELIDGAPA